VIFADETMHHAGVPVADEASVPAVIGHVSIGMMGIGVIAHLLHGR
jgi:hypothetical protein